MHQKILLNTISIYARIVISAIVAIFTTRIILATLGKDDYGLYILIGGVVALLSFLNGALQLATQRFLSISIGKQDWDELKKVFNCSVMLHLGFATAIFIIFKTLQPLLFDNFLNIEESKVEKAVSTYNIVIITTCITFLTVPYNAVFNAREDMWVLAITDVIGSLLRLVAAVAITFSGNVENLIVEYSLLILLSVVIVFIVKIIWSMFKYPESIIDRGLMFDIKQIKDQLSFTGWNTLVTFAMVCQTQGVAVVLNIFFGTAINAAYGIAYQIYSLVLTSATTLSTVFSPQIIQSRGAGDNERMLRIATFSSKLAFYAASVIGIPLILENKSIMKLWLINVPEYSSIFCILIILIFIVMEMYPGLVRCLFAHGDIKWYQIANSALLISPIPLGYLGFKYFNAGPQFILIFVLIAQIFNLIVTVYFSKKLLQLDVKNYVKGNIFKLLLIFCIVLICGLFIKQFISNDLPRIIISSVNSLLLFTLLFIFVILTKEERSHFKRFNDGIISKLVKYINHKSKNDKDLDNK